MPSGNLPVPDAIAQETAGDLGSRALHSFMAALSRERLR